MDALGIFKFWRNTAAGADVSPEVDDGRNSSFDGTDEETDDDDSLFDLAFKSPEVKKLDEDLKKKKECWFIDSPRDVFLSENEFPSPKPQSPVTILRSAPKLKVFMLGFKKSPKCEKTESDSASPVNHLSKPSRLEQSNRFSVISGPAVGSVSARGNSLRSNMLKESCDYEASSAVKSSVPKYMKLIKPFYVKASNKAKSTDSVTPSSSPVTAPVTLSPRKFVR